MRDRTEKALGKREERLVAELDATARLHKLATLSVSDTGLEPILKEIVDVAIAFSGADFGNIQLVDPISSALRIVAQCGFPQWWVDFWNNVAKGQGTCGVALERGERVIVQDVERSAIFAGTPALEIQLKAGVRAVQSTPLVSRSGKPIGMFSTHYRTPNRPDDRALRLLDLLSRQAADIIEHTQMAAALAESEERFRALVTASSYAVYRMSADWTEMRLLDGKGFISDTQSPSVSWLQEYIYPEDQPRVMEAIQNAIRTQSIFQLEHRVRRLDGTLGWTLSRAVPLLNANGEVTEWFGAASDVTERRQAEEALLQSEAQFRTLANAIPQLCWTGNADGWISWYNQRWYEYTGTTREQMEGWGWMSVHDPEMLPKVLKRWKHSIATGKPFDMVVLLRGADGVFRPFLTRGVPVFDRDGKVAGWFGTSTDIGEQRRVEEELRKANEEREQQARLKDEFLALLGHELRNPLAAISNAMQLLSGGVSARKRASLEELILRQVAVLGRLVDDLLDLSRISHGQIGLQKEPIDLSELLQRAAAAAQSAVAVRGQEMVVRMPHGRVLFMADRVRLKQIAANLLNNASKYTGREGRIEFSGAREGSEVVIRCRDYGRGIPLEMQQKIFEPFVRGEMAGQSAEAGLGIGLALVKRLVELHGGTVSVESGGSGTGSEFTVRLPLVEAPPAPRGTSKAAPAPRFRSALSLVIVEDNPDAGQTLALALEQAGHQVTVFADGPSALSGLAGLKPDAVLLDIGLPGMDGYEVAGKMRKHANLRHALLIGLSGFKRRAHRGRSGGDFDDYFVKPVDLAKLLTRLETPARAGATEATASRRAPAGSKPLRVLLVEDNADLAAATEELLRSEGLEVRTAFSGQEALDATADFPPQLILCDLNLPDMKGGEVIRRLRSESATRRTHAVILTAISESAIHVYNSAAKQMGVDEFIAKPITPDALRRVLARLTPSRRVPPKRRAPSKMTS